MPKQTYTGAEHLRLSQELVVTYLLYGGSKDEKEKKGYGKKIRAQEEALDRYVDEAKAADGFLPLHFVAETFGLNSFLTLCVYMSLYADLSRKVGEVFTILQEDEKGSRPTVGFVYELFSTLSIHKKEVPSPYVFFESGELALRFVFLDTFYTAAGALLQTPLVLSRRILSFILNEDVLVADEVADLCTLFLPGQEEDRYIGSLKAGQALLQKYSDQSVEKICIYGPSGTGKRFLTKHLLAGQRLPALFLDFPHLHARYMEDREVLTSVFRELLLTNTHLCLCGVQSEHTILLTLLIGELKKLGITKCILLYDSPTPPHFPFQMALLYHPLPNEEQSIALWEHFGAKLNISMDFAYISSVLSLTPIQHEQSLFTLQTEGLAATPENLLRTATSLLSHGLDAHASRVHLLFGWKDLYLDEPIKNKLKACCNHVKYKHTVLTQWNIGSILSYGRGLCMLFYGPSGTGKTMAAQVMAKELGLPLFRVDLSRVISKYIGETEQNLNRIFDEAAKIQAVLFFDEADALFSKRTEIRDSVDKYSNAEVSFLLQKTEEYSGVVVLASNLMQNLDEAFMRRIHYAVYFPLPDATMRKSIWKGLLLPEIPLGSDLDLNFLSETFEISPASIKQVILNAAFAAAGEGSDICMKHILLAMKNELSKSGKVVLRSELEAYAADWENDR